MHLRSSALRLHHLPSELLGVIAEHLGRRGGAKSVCSFSRACKSFHAVAFEPDVWAPVACRSGKMFREIIYESGTAHALSLCKNIQPPVWSHAKVTPEALEARVKHLPMPALGDFVFSFRLHLVDDAETTLLANASCRYESFHMESDRFRDEDGTLRWGVAFSTSLPLWQAWEEDGHEAFHEREWTSVPPCAELPSCLSKEMSQLFDDGGFDWRLVRLRVYLSRAGRVSSLYNSFLPDDAPFFCMGESESESLDEEWWADYQTEFPERKLAKINGSTFPDVPEARKIGLDAGNLVVQPTLDLDFEKKAGVPYCIGGKVGLKFLHGPSGSALAPDELAHLLEAVLDARPKHNRNP
jgi:hypothetical protein